MQAQRDALVAKVDNWRDKVLGEVDHANRAADQQLTSDAHKVHQELDSLLQLRQRVHHALGQVSDAQKVCVEREMREGPGSEERLDKVKDCVPATTVRPGLHCDHSFVSEDDIRHFLGSPVQLSLPCAAASEVVVPIYRCDQDRGCREVHNLCYVSAKQIIVSYGGISPDYAAEQHIYITDKSDAGTGRLLAKHVNNSRASFLKYSSECSCYNKYNETTNYSLNAKGGALFNVKQKDCKTLKVRKITVQTSTSTKARPTHVFCIHSGKPVAFDATTDGQLFVVVGERNLERSHKTERTVRLFHPDHSDPFAIYVPSDAGFHPADVCFWHENGQNKLLVADSQNDCVHVVKMEDDECHFERYLAAGSGHLLRPTALEVDDQGRVWIGCGNGWILRCEKALDCGRSPVDCEGSPVDESISSLDSSAVSHAGQLMVRNSSRSKYIQKLRGV